MPADREALLIGHTASIVAAFVARNQLRPSAVPDLISAVYDALAAKLAAQPVATATHPAVPIDQSVHPDFLVCLECGKKFSSLRRHIGAAHRLNPNQYREKWGLPPDYPMIAPTFASMRSISALHVWRERRNHPEVQ